MIIRTITLGSEVECVVTGFRGIVTSRAIHMNGCDRYWIQPKVGADGKFADGLWCDVHTLKVLGAPVELPEPSYLKAGGPHSRIK